MACPSYTVVPGSSGTAAVFGGPVTLTAAAGGFGLVQGTVSLKCADATLHPLTIVSWTDSIIIATLPPSSPCSGPYQIVVHIVVPASDCPSPIDIQGGLVGNGIGGDTLVGIAKQIVALTQIDWDPKVPKAGDPIFVRIIPGYSPSALSGTLPLPTGDKMLDLTGKAVKVTVKYAVEKNGSPVNSTDYSVTPISAPIPDSDPIEAILKIGPEFVDELKVADPTNFQLVVTVTVYIDGAPLATGPLKVPIPIPPVPFPGVLVLSEHANHSGRIFVLVRAQSALSSVGAVVNSLNSIIQIVNSVKDVVSFATLVLPPLHKVVDTITSAAGVAGLATGGAIELDDYDDFDDEASSLLLLGPPGVKIELHSMGDYDGETSTFTATAIGSSGIGFHDQPSFGDWDTDSGDSMNDDVESVRFV